MNKRKLVVLDAPSNLGLRPPEEGVVPGCYKLPWALRNRGLLTSVGAEDEGSLIPPRYESRWRPGEGTRNAEAIAHYSRLLADRLISILGDGNKPVVLGGDCSILIGSMLALKRMGRFGLIFLDAHSDFRHPGNSKELVAAAGEDLAIVTGRGDSRLIDLEGRGPYVQDADVHVVGIRQADAHLDELRAKRIRVTTSKEIKAASPSQLADQVIGTVTKHTSGFWVHLDADVVDASEMIAVDCPEPEGPSVAALGMLLKRLISAPGCVGMHVTIYDPDRDPTGECADRLVSSLKEALACVPTAPAQIVVLERRGADALAAWRRKSHWRRPAARAGRRARRCRPTSRRRTARSAPRPRASGHAHQRCSCRSWC